MRPIQLSIPTTSPFTLAAVGAGGRRCPPAVLDARLHLPASRGGPYPAVVLAHGLGGVLPTREERYARFLAEHGYAALVYDSFISRGRHRFSDTIRALRTTETTLLADAFAALAALAKRDDIRSDAISIAGFSYGGMIAPLTAYAQIADLFLPQGPRFASHIGYYGSSVPRLENPATTGAPVTLMYGERDDNVDLKRAEAIAGDLKAGGSKVDMTVFANTRHQWDGADRVPRFVSFSIAGCQFRVSADNTVRCEKSGMLMRGMVSRTVMIGRSASRSGYWILRDPAVTEMSDAILLASLRAAITERNPATALAAAAVPMPMSMSEGAGRIAVPMQPNKR